jgi:hypothetical protein
MLPQADGCQLVPERGVARLYANGAFQGRSCLIELTAVEIGFRLFLQSQYRRRRTGCLRRGRPNRLGMARRLGALLRDGHRLDGPRGSRGFAARHGAGWLGNGGTSGNQRRNTQYE